MQGIQRSLTALICFGLCSSLLFAFNPAVGGESFNSLLAADLLGGNASAAGGPMGPAQVSELLTNPALSAGEQRITLDVSYAALIGTGDDDGLGHSVNLGALYPTRWGVLGASSHFISSPFDTHQTDTAGFFHASFAKDLTDRFYLGAGLLAATGSGWGLNGSLGMLYQLGDLGFMKDAKVGFSVTGLGKAFTPDKPGIDGEDQTGYPSAFTPRLGLGATLIKEKDVKIGASVDLSSPTFQNLVFDTGLEALIKDFISIRTGWNYNLKESTEKAQTFIPSIGLGINLKLAPSGEDTFLSRNGWDRSEVTPNVGVKPLFKDIWAVGGGVTVRLGVTDTNPPLVEPTYAEPVYFSPNSDGVNDDLILPVAFSDERYIMGWAFIVEDDKGNPVRTIANKEIRPEMQDIASFWSLLTRPKQGIPLPESVRWDGSTDSGEIAGDGAYQFYLTSVDDNQNAAKTEKTTVYIDNTPPSLTVTPPTAAAALIFSPDGDGNKDTFTVSQNGSIEDVWKVEILNSAGAVVRTDEIKETALSTYVWDGKIASNQIAPDGVYAYRVSAVDRAGNATTDRIDNIIVDTVKPAINISIDSNAFSPNGDGSKDTITLTPSIPVTVGLTSWKIDILSKSGDTVRTLGGGNRIDPIVFDGKLPSGQTMKEGEWQAVISAVYINGHAPVAKSPLFTLDVTAPEARTRANNAIFSPVGDGKLDTVTFTQQASEEPSWTGRIVALDKNLTPTDKTIRTYTFASTPDTSLIWDGRDETGKLASDGQYGYILTATDRAGNTGSSPLTRVELNTEKADLILQANLTAFSPNGDGVRDSIIFTPILKAATAVAEYQLAITDPTGKTVKTFAGKGTVPPSFSWNGIADPISGATVGERLPDGMYGASLAVTLINQQTSRSLAPSFEIDTRFPSMELSAPYLVFSPNGDGARDALPIAQISSREELWTGMIVSDKKNTVKTFQWNGQSPSFEWNATDDAGNRVADGNYTYVVESTDRAGNKTRTQLAGIIVDSRVPKAFITAEHAAFSPNADGLKDVQKLSLVTNLTTGLSSWQVSIKAGSNASAPIKTWSSKDQATLPASINWDGKDSSGKIAQGSFIAELTLTYEKGDTVTTATPAFLASTEPPALGVQLSPKYFSPDNDGMEDELFINLQAKSDAAFAQWSFEIREPEGTAGNVFWRTGGTNRITERVIWDGRSLKGELVQAATDYPYTFTVKDELGMTSVVRGYIPVDVLVIREGDRLKIAVPSIIFRENAADFNGLDPAVVEKNTQVLKRIAEILNKFRDYRIQVEGHANNVTGTQKEEDTELIPLSRLRSDAVRDFLIRNGVDGSRLTTVGLGGTRPVVQRQDRENWWKNRRVEFVLIK